MNIEYKNEPDLYPNAPSRALQAENVRLHLRIVELETSLEKATDELRQVKSELYAEGVLKREQELQKEICMSWARRQGYDEGAALLCAMDYAVERDWDCFGEIE